MMPDSAMPEFAEAILARQPRITTRVTTPDPAATQTIPHVAAASLRLPAAVVRQRAATFAERTRALGAPHSLRIWREAHRAALIQLAREASGVPIGVPCAQCEWRREGDLYYVAARFAPTHPTIH